MRQDDVLYAYEIRGDTKRGWFFYVMIAPDLHTAMSMSVKRYGVARAEVEFKTKFLGQVTEIWGGEEDTKEGS